MEKETEEKAGFIQEVGHAPQDTSHSVPAHQAQAMQLIIAYLQKYDRIDEGRSEIIELFKKFISDERTNRALGCLFGSLIGDALGAFCQFLQSIQPQLLEKTMTMPGGGTFNLRQGQYTDDSELAFHLLSALTTFNVDRPLKDQQSDLLRSIALEYIKWDESGPFDIGQTCSKGLDVLFKNRKEIQGNAQANWQNIIQQVYKYNSKSESNGSLMRIEPMAIFLAMINQDPALHTEFIQSQISLMHPNPMLRAAGAAWVNALSLTINRADNKTQNFAKIWDRVSALPQCKQLHTNTWYGKQKLPRQHSLPGNTNMGWAKIAWTYGMRILKTLGKPEENINVSALGSDFYKNEIEWVISRAGDTDTNACIVGGLLGSVIGFTKLPAEYLKKIFTLRFPQTGAQEKQTDRPVHYQPLNVLVMALKFIEKCQRYKPANS